LKITTAAILFFASILPAAAEEPTVMVFGIGTASCAMWMSEPQLETEGQVWILGYWSGINMVNGSMVGHSTDGLGIIERVKEACRADPALRLANAVGNVRAEFRENDR
jgi:hypothetical protein